MSDNILYLKFLCGITLIVIGIAVYKFLIEFKYSDHHTRSILFSIFIISRILFFLLVFVIIGIRPQSDIPSYYYPQAIDAINGLLPYKDFPSSYSPLFAYFTAIAILIYNSDVSIILLSIFIEIVSVIVWYKIALKLTDPATSNKILFVYIFNFIPFWIVVFSGQNQIWISLFLGLSIYFMIKLKYGFAGLIFAFGFLVTKFLTLIFGFPLFLYNKILKKFTIGFLSLAIIIYSILFLLGIDFLLPLKIEGQDYTSGNLIYLSTLLFPTLIDQSLVLNIFLLMIILFLLIYIKKNIFQHVELNDIKLSFIIINCLIFLLFLLFSKKSYTNYLAIIMFPLIMSYLTIESNLLKNYLILSAFGVVAVLEPSLWFRLLNQQKLDSIFILNFWDTTSLGIFFFITIEVALLGFYFFFFKKFLFNLKSID